MKHINILKINLMRATMTLALMVTCAMAWADNDPVSYIAADGTTQTCTNYTMLTGNESTIGTSGETTWYVVNSDINRNGSIECFGTIHLILCDGKTLTVTGENTGVAANYNLTIYGQSGQSGTLNATASTNGIYASDITINDGIVNGTGTLQVVDVMGQVIRTVGLSQCGSRTSTAEMTPGIYVLRLINGNDARTQKMVIE